MASRSRRLTSHRRWWNREFANTPYWFLIIGGSALVAVGIFILLNWR